MWLYQLFRWLRYWYYCLLYLWQEDFTIVMEGYTEAVVDIEAKQEDAGMRGCKDSRDAASRKGKADAVTTAGTTIKVLFPKKYIR